MTCSELDSTFDRLIARFDNSVENGERVQCLRLLSLCLGGDRVENVAEIASRANDVVRMVHAGFDLVPVLFDVDSADDSCQQSLLMNSLCMLVSCIPRHTLLNSRLASRLTDFISSSDSPPLVAATALRIASDAQLMVSAVADEQRNVERLRHATLDYLTSRAQKRDVRSSLATKLLLSNDKSPAMLATMEAVVQRLDELERTTDDGCKATIALRLYDLLVRLAIASTDCRAAFCERHLLARLVRTWIVERNDDPLVQMSAMQVVEDFCGSYHSVAPTASHPDASERDATDDFDLGAADVDLVLCEIDNAFAAIQHRLTLIVVPSLFSLFGAAFCYRLGSSSTNKSDSLTLPFYENVHASLVDVASDFDSRRRLTSPVRAEDKGDDRYDTSLHCIVMRCLGRIARATDSHDDRHYILGPQCSGIVVNLVESGVHNPTVCDVGWRCICLELIEDFIQGDDVAIRSVAKLLPRLIELARQPFDGQFVVILRIVAQLATKLDECSGVPVLNTIAKGDTLKGTSFAEWLTTGLQRRLDVMLPSDAKSSVLMMRKTIAASLIRAYDASRAVTSDSDRVIAWNKIFGVLSPDGGDVVGNQVDGEPITIATVRRLAVSSPYVNAVSSQTVVGTVVEVDAV